METKSYATEIIYGEKAIEMLHAVIDSRRVCKMGIPNTLYGWITLLLGFQKVGNSQYIIIDKVAEFEKALSRYQNPEVSLEFLEMTGVTCQFKTRVVGFHSNGILAELPQSISRLQRRRYFRVTARAGTEIVFHVNSEKEERGIVKDYSLGGVAFFMDRSLKLSVDDHLTKLELRIPHEKEWITFQIPRAVVRRIENHFPGKDLCAIEFLEMEKTLKEPLWHHIFEEQRLFLRRTKKG